MVAVNGACVCQSPNVTVNGVCQAPVPVISITIAPLGSTVVSGSTLQFTTTITGTSNTAVTWTTTLGTISSTGLFTAQTVTSNTIVTIKATSVADTTKTASTTLTVMSVPVSTNTFIPGDRVVVNTTGTGGVFVRATPAASGTLLGTQAPGVLGTILAGPTIDSVDKLPRWNVNYDSGPDGWSIESRLSKSTVTPPPVQHGVSLSWVAPIVAAGTRKGSPPPPPVASNKSLPKKAGKAKLGVFTYNVYRSQTKGGPYAISNSQPITTTTFLDISAVVGTTYYYVCTTVNPTNIPGKQESVYSNEVSITR